MNIFFLFPGQTMPPQLFTVVEVANTIQPKIASFTFVFVSNKTAKFYIFGRHLFKFRMEPSKTKLMMRPVYNTEFHHIC